MGLGNGEPTFYLQNKSFALEFRPQKSELEKIWERSLNEINKIISTNQQNASLTHAHARTHAHIQTNSHLKGRGTQYTKFFLCFVWNIESNSFIFKKVKLLLRLIWKEFLFSVCFSFFHLTLPDSFFFVLSFFLSKQKKRTSWIDFSLSLLHYVFSVCLWLNHFKWTQNKRWVFILSNWDFNKILAKCWLLRVEVGLAQRLLSSFTSLERTNKQLTQSKINKKKLNDSKCDFFGRPWLAYGIVVVAREHFF